MQKIILIGTRHDGIGKCSERALFEILLEIRPEVIFEELFIDGHKQIYEGNTPDFPETRAIKKYIELEKAKIIPVDLDYRNILNNLRKDGLNDFVEVFYRNAEFLRRNADYNENSAKYGFRYINSNECVRSFEYKHFLENGILEYLKNDQYSDLHRRYLDMNNDRENEMLNNIYQYCKLNDFKSAVFLIGAEHIRSIIYKAPRYESVQDLKINWVFDYFH